jgi:hypothetical protein
MERICNNSNELEYIMVTKEQKEAIKKNDFLLSKVNKDGTVIFRTKNLEVKQTGIINKDGTFFEFEGKIYFYDIIRSNKGYTFLRDSNGCCILNKKNVPFDYEGQKYFYNIYNFIGFNDTFCLDSVVFQFTKDSLHPTKINGKSINLDEINF